MTGGPVYLDYAASTPMAPEVAEFIRRWLDPENLAANAASPHLPGRRAADAVEKSREQVANLLGAAAGQIVFTSGATESNNLAILGAARARAHKGRHLITMRTEHKAVREAFCALEREGFSVDWLDPESDGVLRPDVLDNALREDTQLVSVMAVNNETGVMQDIHALAGLCRKRGVLFHTDAAQAVGKVSLDLNALPVDLLSLTAHKFYGPQGVGALYIRDAARTIVEPLLFGGNQERGIRPGTLPVMLIAAMGEAASLAVAKRTEDFTRMAFLRRKLWQGIADVDGVTRNGSSKLCYPGILNVSVTDIDGESLRLAMEPVCVASGSACNATSGEPSYVLRAMGRSDALAESAVRFSFGRATTDAEIELAIDRYRYAIGHLRRMAPVQAA